jgi:hypothetical protein
MPDWWEDANGLNKSNPSDAAADTDGDGVSNLKEFIARTNPRDANSALRTTPQRAPGGFQIGWPSVIGARYRVQFSSDLKTWTDVVPDEVASSTFASWLDPAPLPTRRFYRVQALP